MEETIVELSVSSAVYLVPPLMSPLLVALLAAERPVLLLQELQQSTDGLQLRNCMEWVFKVCRKMRLRYELIL